MGITPYNILPDVFSSTLFPTSTDSWTELYITYMIFILGLTIVTLYDFVII